MVVRGRVHEGVIILPDGVRLPEGQEVTVLAPAATSGGTHGVLEIAPVSLGSIMRPFTPEDDRLGEMLEGRS